MISEQFFGRIHGATRLRRRAWPDTKVHARMAFGLAFAFLMAGCLQSQPTPVDESNGTAEFVYSWNTTAAFGLDGGVRIEVRPPATECEIGTSIAGWTSDPGIDALWLSVPPAPESINWIYSVEASPYVRSGPEDTSAWRAVLGAGGTALHGGGGNMTQGGVIYMLAKNLTSWAAPDGQVFPSLEIEARCDAPGLSVTYARDALFLNERNMEKGTVASSDLVVAGAEVAATQGAGAQRELNGIVDLFAMSVSAAQNNLAGVLSVEAPDAQYSWTIGPDMFYEQGLAGQYRAEVNRVAAPLVGCTEPGAPCRTNTGWWGFIAGFEETDDPDAFFGIDGA